MRKQQNLKSIIFPGLCTIPLAVANEVFAAKGTEESLPIYFAFLCNLPIAIFFVGLTQKRYAQRNITEKV